MVDQEELETYYIVTGYKECGTYYGLMSYTMYNYNLIHTSKSYNSVCNCLDELLLTNRSDVNYYALYQVNNWDPEKVSYTMLSKLNIKHAILCHRNPKLNIRNKNKFDINIRNNLLLFNEYVKYNALVSKLSLIELTNKYYKVTGKKCTYIIFKKKRIINKLIKLKIEDLLSQDKCNFSTS